MSRLFQQSSEIESKMRSNWGQNSIRFVFFQCLKNKSKKSDSKMRKGEEKCPPKGVRIEPKSENKSI
mgnify:CR=1 FL=1